jgi:hypothetical protein
MSSLSLTQNILGSHFLAHALTGFEQGQHRHIVRIWILRVHLSTNAFNSLYSSNPLAISILLPGG